VTKRQRGRPRQLPPGTEFICPHCEIDPAPTLPNGTMAPHINKTTTRTCRGSFTAPIAAPPTRRVSLRQMAGEIEASPLECLEAAIDINRIAREAGSAEPASIDGLPHSSIMNKGYLTTEEANDLLDKITIQFDPRFRALLSGSVHEASRAARRRLGAPNEDKPRNPSPTMAEAIQEDIHATRQAQDPPRRL
jgi:hypothetical protein